MVMGVSTGRKPQQSFEVTELWRDAVAEFADETGAPIGAIYMAALNELLKRPDAVEVVDLFRIASNRPKGALTRVRPGELALRGQKPRATELAAELDRDVDAELRQTQTPSKGRRGAKAG